MVQDPGSCTEFCVSHSRHPSFEHESITELKGCSITFFRGSRHFAVMFPSVR